MGKRSGNQAKGARPPTPPPPERWQRASQPGRQPPEYTRGHGAAEGSAAGGVPTQQHARRVETMADHFAARFARDVQKLEAVQPALKEEAAAASAAAVGRVQAGLAAAPPHPLPGSSCRCPGGVGGWKPAGHLSAVYHTYGTAAYVQVPKYVCGGCDQGHGVPASVRCRVRPVLAAALRHAGRHQGRGAVPVPAPARRDVS